jgi:hypothetical protein
MLKLWLAYWSRGGKRSGFRRNEAWVCWSLTFYSCLMCSHSPPSTPTSHTHTSTQDCSGVPMCPGVGAGCIHEKGVPSRKHEFEKPMCLAGVEWRLVSPQALPSSAVPGFVLASSKSHERAGEGASCTLASQFFLLWLQETKTTSLTQKTGILLNPCLCPLSLPPPHPHRAS